MHALRDRVRWWLMNVPSLSWPAHALTFMALTIVTQVGGLLYVLALFLRTRLFPATNRKLAMLSLLFACVYAIAWAPIGRLAGLSGRTALPCFLGSNSTLAASPIACLLHRHYVSPQMKALTLSLSEAVDRRFPRTLTMTLDGNFPFIDGFPIVPHLSHDDGRKLDLAFYYASHEGYARGQLRSPIGYWAFERLGAGEERASRPAGRRPCTRGA